MRPAAAVVALLCAAPSLAQPVPDPQPEKPEPQPAPEALTPPKLIAPAEPAYPQGATGSARVIVQLDIDEHGVPGNLVVQGAAQPGFDEAALAAAAKMRFEPARRGEKPIAVRIQSAFNFTPQPAAREQAAAPVNFAGQIRERGSRRKLAGIEVSAAGRSGFTDKDGRFELRGLPEGAPVEVVVAAPGYQRLVARETIPDGEKLEVEYRLQPLYASPLEATVEGERERTELSRTSVSKEETDKVPGAQGDALKVVEDLPGVARTSPIGGGALVIRGSKPGDSLVYLDGEPLPLLFHFGALSSTFNPDLLEAIDFIPGNFSSRYGDLTGGLVEVRTRKLRDEFHGYANLNLLEGSALVEGAVPEVPGLSVALAGRRSYIDYIIRAAVSDSADLGLTVAPRYYDAQFRLDYRPPDSAHAFSFLALTSDDALGLVLKRPTQQDPNLSGSIDAETGFQQLRLKHEWRSGPL
ncbi:MAG TPA: TonB family protein, partial [Myxococcales bacterium]